VPTVAFVLIPIVPDMKIPCRRNFCTKNLRMGLVQDANAIFSRRLNSRARVGTGRIVRFGETLMVKPFNRNLI
jgi:hypothetical protein